MKKKRPGSYIVFYDGDKILLLHKGYSEYRRHEWGFFGGGIEEGETPEKAIIREVIDKGIELADDGR